MKIRAFLIGVAVFLAATITPSPLSLKAEIIGLEQFDYSDGPIAGKTGGTFWDFGNIAAPVHDGTPSVWSNVSGAPAVASGRLVTDNNNAIRAHNGPSLGFGSGSDEEQGSVSDFPARAQSVVYYRVTFTTGANVPGLVGLDVFDFSTRTVFFGKQSGQPTLGIMTLNGFGSGASSITVNPNTTYTLVAKVDYVNNRLSLFINPTLGGAEPANPSAVINNYTPNNFSTAVRLLSGTGGAITWDDLVVATSWEELNTLVTVTTTDDEDDGPNSLNTPADISLREAVKYSPAGSLITFASALNGQTCTLSLGGMVIDKTLTIDASALANGLTVDANRNSQHFNIDGSTTALTLKSLTLINGNGFNTNGGSIILLSGNLFLQRCTLSDNLAAGAGAIFLQQSGTSRLEECTITGNRATEDDGTGGIVVVDGSCTVSRCTISGNTGTGLGGGLFVQSNASVSLSNCLIAGNSDLVGNDIFRSNVGGTTGTLTANGNNLIGSNATVEDIFPTPGPLVGTQSAPLDPKLSPLGYFGGPTQTMHPLIGSPAIDAGGTTDPGGTDQRGFPRFVNGDFDGTAQLDIGAVEAGPLRNVVSSSDAGSSGSLRGQISRSTEPGARIGFPTSNFPSQSITLNGTELSIPATASIFIDASNLSGPVTISGNPTTPSRVFNIAAGASVAMHSLVIQNGKAPDGATGQTGENGGGILNGGSLSLFSSAVLISGAGNGGNGDNIDGNAGPGGNGGGIFSSGTLSLTNCTLSGNSAGNGGKGGDVSFELGSGRVGGVGGVGGSGGGISSNGPLNLTACTISGNTTGNGGNGGNGSSAGGNTGGSRGSGGGIRKNGQTPYRLTSCTLVGNRTGDGGTGPGGGGFFGDGGGVSGGYLVLQHSLVANNSGPGTGMDVKVTSVAYLGANLLSTSAVSFSTTGPAPIINANPLLAPLANNGGPTQTLALLAGSPAIGAATGSTATSDQRGFPIVGVADLGAFEGQIGSVPSLTTAEDTLVTSASFPAGLVGTVSAISSAPSLVAPANIVLTTNGTTGTLQITPAANANGNATITLQDDFGAQQTFSITVNAVNDAPTFTAGPNLSVVNTAGAQTVSAWATAISPGPTDESAQTLTFSLDATNSGLFSVAPTLTAAGTLSFTPASGAVGTSTIAVRLRDNGGTSNGGIDESAAQNFTITFTAAPPPAPLTRLIKVRANSSSRGTVSGGKRYVNNSFATVRARAKSGFKFVKWTEGTRTVSTQASYRFKVTKNRSLVANFK